MKSQINFGFRDGATGATAVIWFIIGNLIYYAIGITLTFALMDNRAFCKYVCTVSVPLKITSRFSIIKIGGKDLLHEREPKMDHRPAAVPASD